jgi:pectin methylesterase-like acyl-CoA thioesterase
MISWEKRTKMSSKQWILGCVLALAAVTAAHATTFFVDVGQGNNANTGRSATDPFATIQWAIDAAAAQPGPDRIQIAAGPYLENLAISDVDGLTLSGSSGAEIVATPLAAAIQIASGDITISDLAIQAGNKGISAGTLDSPVASLTLRNVVVTNNVTEGLNAVNVADVTVSGCTFRDNGGVAAVKVQFAEDLTVSHCTLESNTG